MDTILGLSLQGPQSKWRWEVGNGDAMCYHYAYLTDLIYRSRCTYITYVLLTPLHSALSTLRISPLDPLNHTDCYLSLTDYKSQAALHECVPRTGWFLRGTKYQAYGFELRDPLQLQWLVTAARQCPVHTYPYSSPHSPPHSGPHELPHHDGLVELFELVG